MRKLFAGVGGIGQFGGGFGSEPGCAAGVLEFDAGAIFLMLSEALSGVGDVGFELGEPFSLCDEHFVGHLPDLLGVANGSDEGVMEHGEFEEVEVGMDGRLHCHFLDADAGGTGGGAGQGEVADDGHVDAIAIDISGDFDDAAVWEVGDMTLVWDVEMSAVGASGLEGFDDIGGMFFGAEFGGDFGRWGL